MFNNKFWLKISLYNLLIVGILGLILRSIFGFGFNFLNLNLTHLIHSHSHFAFSGWVSQTLMVLMIIYLKFKFKKLGVKFNYKTYNLILSFHLLSAYGMLLFFANQGYSFLSICFSVISIICTYFFCYFFYIDLKKIPNNYLSKYWFKCAIFFNALSTLGTWALAYVMPQKEMYKDIYNASINFYLHFQYNGWFAFACMGLLFSLLKIRIFDHYLTKHIITLFFISCLLKFNLHILWIDLPNWLISFTTVASIVQFIAWFTLIGIGLKTKFSQIKKHHRFLKFILLFIFITYSLKLTFQLLTTIPSINHWAHDFKPLVVAYLHLILLGVITLFILFYIYASHLFHYNLAVRNGLILFISGFILNETALGIQAYGILINVNAIYSNELLIGASILMVLGIGTVAFMSKKTYSNKSKKHQLFISKTI